MRQPLPRMSEYGIRSLNKVYSYEIITLKSGPPLYTWGCAFTFV